MVERSRRSRRKRRAKKQPLLGSHQRSWLWGRHVVLETLKAGKWPIYELHFADDLPEAELQSACRMAEDRQVPYTIEASDSLTRLAGSQEHQGYLAKMPPYPYDEIESLDQHWPDYPLFLMLDGIQDPYNFGAILRSAEVLGTDAVLIGMQNQTGVTSLAARSSAGAVNHLRIIRVADAPALLTDWKARGVLILGASEKATSAIDAVDCTGPAVLIIGSEGAGIRPELLAICDQQVTIPQAGRVGSLNAAVSAGILLYEIHRQRRVHLKR